MRTYLSLLLLLLPLVTVRAQTTWQPAGDKIKTEWAGQVDPAQPLPDYPRPQLTRDTWQNLNGLWDYAIQAKEAPQPTAYQGKILVPFAVESALSGVGKTVGKDQALWYHTMVSVPAKLRRNKVLLHFGAVDWETEVWVNGQSAGTHRGGYDPFSFDITALLKKGSAQEITVRVWDPTDEGPQPRGKQVKNPEGIWYTPVTGIWQTVWLEAVPPTYVQHLKTVPNVQNGSVAVAATLQGAQKGDQLRVRVTEGKTRLAEQTGDASGEIAVTIPDPQLWSPENPRLYDLEVAVLRNGKVLDQVKSYTAMRSIEMKPDADGIQRMMLNGKFVFQFGPLDQGWWPDGLYTAPTDAALKFDIEKTKEMGFNMIRKHVKVEPARWYYYCDQMGMLVWQDMPSGDLGARWGNHPGIEGEGHDMDRSAESEHIYRTEWEAIMDALQPFPSIVVWVPFNEAWGQFKTQEITEWTMKKDPSRLVNSASGGNFHPVGHIIDLHHYPSPAMPRHDLFGNDQILVLGEYGGLGLPLEGHTWQQKDNWGYRSFPNADELFTQYSSFVDELQNLIKRGLSAAVYTQTTDVEVEVNGLMTYDRKVIKVPEAKLKQVHEKLYDTSLVQLRP
ncbi:Glycosyl hydrolases family 2, TIM barrel domain [Catalinimonas alkaloidigena]|uniref:Glycosyl hydrolases family 2, TIM barrel domain n=1 Tax=Catalinimonas alkaloidigena TaxID=1075417 RepID=A0A1G9A7P0_9BACT|nr:sugar-binding domain-containing protein [Catalinimonas alkaloidigena]SDK22470.1 Glycosyl hydrolases family 2, TIM barrel domain [Catalinimonas alkaloidigena]